VGGKDPETGAGQVQAQGVSHRFYSPRTWMWGSILWTRWIPGQYPFTAGTYPTFPYLTGERGSGVSPRQRAGPGRTLFRIRAPEDTRDYYLQMKKLGSRTGPNIAFDLPSQCGYDSDSPVASGEVGRVGVAIDTCAIWKSSLRPSPGRTTSTGPLPTSPSMPRRTSSWPCTWPWPKNGDLLDKLRATPQNDILKEFVARGTYIFPPALP